MAKHLALAVMVGLSVCGEAFGSMTTVSPAPASELNHEKILEGVYQGNFTASGSNFLGGGPLGGLSAIRYQDFPGSTAQNVSAPNALASDKTWTANSLFNVTALSVNADLSQQLGYSIDGSGIYQNLFTAGGSGINPGGSATGVNLIGQNFQWIRRNSDGSNAYSSNDQLNYDTLDHMVTYKIDGLNDGKMTWMLCWEDSKGPLGGTWKSDRDFNDLCVKVSTPMSVPVPEPSTFLFLGLVLAGMVGRRRRK